MNKLYKVLFHGEVSNGHNIEDVVKKLAILLKIDQSIIDNSIREKRPLTIKSKISQEQAIKIKNILEEKTGGHFNIIPAEEVLAKAGNHNTSETENTKIPSSATYSIKHILGFIVLSNLTLLFGVWLILSNQPTQATDNNSFEIANSIYEISYPKERLSIIAEQFINAYNSRDGARVRTMLHPDLIALLENKSGKSLEVVINSQREESKFPNYTIIEEKIREDDEIVNGHRTVSGKVVLSLQLPNGGEINKPIVFRLIDGEWLVKNF